LAAILSLMAAIAAPAHAAGLTVVFVDDLTLSRLYDTATGPLDTATLRGAVVALVSPGLPHGADPVANLYATLSAGDVVTAASRQSALLEDRLHRYGADRGVVIVRFGDVDAPGRMATLRSLIMRLRANPAAGRAPGILLVGVAPPFDSPGRRTWDSLTPIAWLSCGGGSTDASLQPTLTSDTTQTTGLIALRDVAPTILAAEDVPIPSSMSGHPARLVEMGVDGSRDAYLSEIDRVTRLSQKCVAPFGWVFGLGGGAILLLGVWCVLGRRRDAAPITRFLVRAVLAVPLSLMLAASRPLGGSALYISEIGVVAVVFAVVPGIGWLTALSALAIVADGVLGAPLISRTVISYYWLSGIRFYGIGNEYMGIVIGFALMAPFVGKERPRSAVRLILMAAWFFLVLFVLAYPAFGAKAGGAVTAMAAFLPCWWALARAKKPSPASWIIGVVLGFASVFALTAIAHHFGARSTHIQAAAAALDHGRLGYIEQVAARKAKMAFAVALAPGAFVGILGMAIVYAIWLRSSLRSRVGTYLAEKPDLNRALISGMWGMLAAALFNDSGSVAALLLFGVLGLSVLHGMLDDLCASSPSMSEMSGSESPSAMSSNSAPIPSSP
jgi:hypothetical protein